MAITMGVDIKLLHQQIEQLKTQLHHSRSNVELLTSDLMEIRSRLLNIYNKWISAEQESYKNKNEPKHAQMVEEKKKIASNEMKWKGHEDVEAICENFTKFLEKGVKQKMAQDKEVNKEMKIKDWEEQERLKEEFQQALWDKEKDKNGN